MPDFQDDQRLSDKLKNAFTIDLLANAQTALENRGIKLSAVGSALGADVPTYDKNAEVAAVKRFSPLIMIGILFVAVMVFRRF